MIKQYVRVGNPIPSQSILISIFQPTFLLQRKVGIAQKKTGNEIAKFTVDYGDMLYRMRMKSINAYWVQPIECFSFSHARKDSYKDPSWECSGRGWQRCARNHDQMTFISWTTNDWVRSTFNLCVWCTLLCINHRPHKNLIFILC